MEDHETLKRQHAILHYLSNIPPKILSLHGADNVTEFVLHALCDKSCFDLKRAAYFVDNPDFNCLKGVAGCAQDECFGDKCAWQNPKDFSSHMQSASFNQQVRDVMRCSVNGGTEAMKALTEEVAKDLVIHNFSVYSWPMKHGNHGVLVYEKGDNSLDHLIPNGVCLLGFCPIF